MPAPSKRPTQRKPSGRSGPATNGSFRLAVFASILGLALALACCGDDDGQPVEATWRIVIEPCGGNLTTQATGAAVGSNLVATVAHGLDETHSIELRADERVLAGQIVYLDPAKDVALLRTDDPLPARLDLVAPSEPGPVDILGRDADGRPVTEPAQITELVDVTLDGAGRRAAARLVADIEPGESGAAVVDDDGRMVAMVFATARGQEVGWAISAAEVIDALDAVERDDDAGHQPPAC